MSKKAIILNEIGSIEYKELKDEYIYKPTPEEEDEHGTKVYALQNGEVGDNEIEVEAVLGSICTHEVSLYKGDLTHPRYPMVPGHEAVHRVVKVGKNVKHLKAVTERTYKDISERILNGKAVGNTRVFKIVKPEKQIKQED
ncbi:MAG: alcohol dehydrogenase catalytic domain-containing protein [Clostridia bacterium]|nr:alcohol dehydrogenase catalytic domain-containing protein [Clostridia bacterium]